jgi:hypothetical protein
MYHLRRVVSRAACEVFEYHLGRDLDEQSSGNCNWLSLIQIGSGTIASHPVPALSGGTR